MKRPQGFPGGSVVKNPLTRAKDMGLSPGLERSHVPQSIRAHPRTVTTDARVLDCALQQEKPPQGEASTPQLDSSPHAPQLEKGPRSSEDPAQQR